MSSDEFNKGYFSTGPQHSHDARMGQFARMEEERRSREAEAAKLAKQQEDYRRSAISASESQFRPQLTWGNRQGASDSSTPATLVGCVKGFAFTGTLLSIAYAYFGLHLVAWGQLATWGVKGALAGAAAGVAAYAVIVFLRIAMAILAVALKIAFFVAVVVGGLYLLKSTL